ncbi:phage tail protein [Candidatus Williamhamiltonella defendens]|uniref:Phage tail collar domain-containing protein n=1 Tax=Candidatus Williamhamiltonella defendens TaxID=138072 RepID=A0A2D3TEY4_9ENTR|nr:phage tail protein [Candidatus Hamiltonella defensa]ATW34244.1 hypothetical protein BJP43_08235 [Candidatus Hamiltonella defensa]
MTDLTELSQWEDGIYQIETRDPVLGGPEGIANRQAQQLGNRTTFLKEGQDRLNTEFYHHREEEDPHPVYALKKSPDFTGEPKAPTPEFKNSSRQLATTEFVTRAVNALTDGAPEALDTLKELAKALGEERDFSTQILQQLSQKLSKNDHGADIPNKAQFIKNLGLSETVDCAKNAAPSHRKINGKALTQDIHLTADDVKAVTPEALRVDIPVGVPLPWPTDRPPTGWRLCNGDRFDKTQYPLLALAYPSGQLPDLRGEFIRGADAGRKIDTGRKVLSTQGDAIRNITGQFGYVRQGQWAPWVTATGAFYQTSTFSAAIKRGDPDNWGSVSAFDASRVVPTAHENRPRNIAFNYIVRAA